MRIYVSARERGGDGTESHPFHSIGQAARVALPGDEVIVKPGIYREYVDPANTGTPDKRILYRSEIPHAAIISGAEKIEQWVRLERNVWQAVIPNGIFGDYNPYQTEIFGDWYNPIRRLHTGEIYLNEKALYEVETLDEVRNPQALRWSWDPEGSVFQWCTTQDGSSTILYANFQGFDPNQENVEINVRRNCFYPSKEGVGYITLSGFTVTKAATQWAPPTAYQEGMVGPHWSKGWIIEDCDISQSRCCGISLGKYLQPGNDNKWSRKRIKTGTQTEREAICQAQTEGWTKERIGSHIIRRCNIHDCGQAGIVGHLGGVFSIIEDNDIHHINNKQDLGGAEIGGIKMHAAIDVIIRRNRFHHCTRGLWLDWQAQGTRVTQNVFYGNMPPKGTQLTDSLSVAEDIFVEVSHGPTLIDNNVILSEIALRLCTQGIALVHNLIAGSFVYVGSGTDNGTKYFSSDRYTPYHMPHRTEIAGFMTILHGDARFYNNIFVQQPIPELLRSYATERDMDRLDRMNYIAGTKPYDGYPSAEQYFTQFSSDQYKLRENRDRYYDHLPVYTGGNVYCNGAQPFDGEENFLIVEEEIKFRIEENDDRLEIATNLYQFLPESRNEMITSVVLGEAFEPEERFENPDGSPITFCEDYYGNHRDVFPMSGPFETGTGSGRFVL